MIADVRVDAVPNRSSPSAFPCGGACAEAPGSAGAPSPIPPAGPGEGRGPASRAQGRRPAGPGNAFTIESPLPRRHIDAVPAITRRPGPDRPIVPGRRPERGRVPAMVVERLLRPASKPAAIRLRDATAPARAPDLDEDDAYGATDRLPARRARIVRRPAPAILIVGFCGFFRGGDV